MMYILVVLLLLHRTGRNNCEPVSDQVKSQCNSGYYWNSNKCDKCFYYCYTCDNGYTCQECVSPQCTLCTTNCSSESCSASDCSNCIDGYYLHSSGVCYRCDYTSCACTKWRNCPKCLPGKHGTYCQYSCSHGCKNGLCNKQDGHCAGGCISGKYGLKCKHMCSELCKNNLCDQGSGGCTDGCIDGYYNNSGVCYECPNGDRCVKCVSSTKCTECIPGKRGDTCQVDCHAGCRDNICDIDSDTCSLDSCESGYYFTYSNSKCNPCRSSSCSGCINPYSCNACTSDQYWGTYCQYNCDNCLSGCKIGNGCSTCYTGYYRQFDNSKRGYICSRCPERCSSCTSALVCNLCKSGFAKRDIYYKCECDENVCASRISGNCEQCSSPGWYPSGVACCPCHTNCKGNECFSNGTCKGCIDSSYGQYCQYSCSAACADKLCHRDGTCVACQDTSKYGKFCNFFCNQRIWRCSACLLQADNSLICLKCVDGYYVDNNKCTVCNSNCKAGDAPVCNSTTGSCNYGCKYGFVGEKCDTTCEVRNCQLCSADNASVCKICKNAFYLKNATSCVKCPTNCKIGTQCDAFNGTCKDGCSDSWSGEQCDQPCHRSCKTCDQFKSSYCGLCNIGFYGDGCESNCSSQCLYRDNDQLCNKTNGHCNFGCNDGFWDYKCRSVCGPGCNGSLCNITTGACIYGCINDYFGETCTAKCSIHCMKTQPGRTCEESNGNCLIGCTPGWFGKECANKCSDQCNETICDRINGTCIFGCIDGYTGPKCMQAMISNNESSKNVEAIGAGAGVGVALVLALVVIVSVFLWRKRRMSSKLAGNGNGKDYVSPDYKKTDPDLVYSNIDDTDTLGNEGFGDTGVSNQVYANVCMSQISKEEEQNTIVDTVEPVCEECFKEEEIVDCELEAMESESDAGEVDSTYYNVAGKRVTVANLPEYVKNKRRGDIYADFQRIPKGLLKDYKEAKKVKNVHKNKYRLIYPYDESRVILHDGGTDYMNASYIEGYNTKKEYIASSGPFAKSYDTTPDFWRMIWQEKCENIVMLTNPVENGDTKCVKYWPEPDTSATFGNLQVTCLTEDQYADFIIRIFTLTQGDESFNVRHLHFTAWPDKGVPHDVTSIIEFRQKVRGLHKNKNCPLLVHCSAGIGRTGTFIALDMLSFEGEDRGSVDVFGCVTALRSQRCNMVQTKEQYDYLHHAVLHSLTFDCRSIAGDMFLQNFNKLIEKTGGKRMIDKQFQQQLQSTTEEMMEEDKAEVVRNQSLRNKNREGADIPVDVYRVKLHENRKPGAVDYVNAVWINGFRTHHKFIVAQTPLPSTVVDFLTLVQQEKCSCIVMMEEADITDKTVGVYWPADNQSIKHGVFKISCKDSTSTQHYTKKTLSIMCHGQKGEEIHDVNLLIFTKWPKENAVPKTSDSVLELVKAVDTINRSKDNESTIVVHCMTGSERSCVFCAVSILIEKMEIEHEVSVVNTLRQIKARRRSAFPSLDQYKFCHQAVIGYLQSFNIYSNIGLKDSEASCL